MFLFTASLFVLFLVSLFQLTNYAFVGPIKPDLALVLVIFLSFIYKDWIKRLILIFLAAVIFKFGVGLELGNGLFIVSSLIGIITAEKLPGSLALNFIVGISIATLVMNITSFHVTTFLLELTYNLSALLVYYLIYKLWPK